MKKKQFSVLGIMVLIVLGIIAGQIGKEAGEKVVTLAKPSQADIDDLLIKGFSSAAEEINEMCPIMLDKETRLDRATVGPGTRAVYHHTFPKYSSIAIDGEWLSRHLQPEVLDKICVNPDMKKSLQYGGIYVYSYSGNDGLEVARFEIDREDCGLPARAP